MSYTLIMTVPEMESDNEKWLKLRREGIGGSEIGIILGYSPFATPYKLWLQKTDPAYFEELTDKTKELFYFGHKIEQVVADAFTDRTGIKVKKQGMIRSNEKPFAFANVDRVIVGADENGKKGFLECKNVSAWAKDEWEEDELPSTYYLQLQWYMFVGDYDYAYIAALIGGNHLVVKKVERDDADIAIMVEAAEKFWNENVIGGKMPDVDGSKSCTEALKKKLTSSDGEEKALDGNFVSLVRDRIKMKEEIDTLKEGLDKIDNQIRLFMDDSPKAESEEFLVTYKSSSRKEFDKEKFAKDYPKVYPNYITSKPVRTLRITAKKEKTSKKRGN